MKERDREKSAFLLMCHSPITEKNLFGKPQAGIRSISLTRAGQKLIPRPITDRGEEDSHES